MLAKTNGRENIIKEDIEELNEIFRDAKYTAKLLAEQQNKYV